MIRARTLAVVALAGLAGPAGAAGTASPVAEAPAGVAVGTSPAGRVYVGKDGRTLYGLSLRSARARTSLTLTYCTGTCARLWTPFTPVAGAKAVAGWTIVEGAQGPQWAFDGSPVFAFNADTKAGDVRGDRWKDLFLPLAYVPPRPALIAPPSVEARLIDASYVLTDTGGHALFTSPCTSDCAPRTGFAAAAASLPVGDWTILRDRDRPQWAWRGSPVFVAVAAGVPDTDTQLKP